MVCMRENGGETEEVPFRLESTQPGLVMPEETRCHGRVTRCRECGMAMWLVHGSCLDRTTQLFR